MNAPANQMFLSEDEVLFHRMESFHRQRVEIIASGQSPLGKRDDGFLVVHLLPHRCFKSRDRFDGATLKVHGSKLSAFGDEGRYAASRFNVDGLLNIDSEKSAESYTQIFRNGHLESVMTAITFQTNGHFAPSNQEHPKRPRYLRDTTCERAVFKLVKEYLSFCQGVGFPALISMFSALVDCKDVVFHSQWGHRSGTGGIDRSPAFLPDIEIGASDGEQEKLMRPWCDTLTQAMGFDKSPNYDEEGNWRERRR